MDSTPTEDSSSSAPADPILHLEGQEIRIGGDVVGRDKITTHITIGTLALQNPAHLTGVGRDPQPEVAGQTAAVAPTQPRLDLTRDRPHLDRRRLPLFVINQSSDDDIRALDSFLSKLQFARDGVSRWLRSAFTPATIDHLLRYDQSLPFPEQYAIAKAVIDDLNRIIQGPCIYDAARFAGVTLTIKTLDLLAQQPTGVDLVRLNRWLIADTYFAELRKHPSPHSFRYHVAIDLMSLASAALGIMAFVAGLAQWLATALGQPGIGFVWLDVPSLLVGGAILFAIGAAITFRPMRFIEDPWPGNRKVQIGDLGGSSAGPIQPHDPELFGAATAPVTVITERVSCYPLREAEWELHVQCGLINQSADAAVLFDIHSDEYLYRDFHIPAAMLGHRPDIITLLQDNTVGFAPRLVIPAHAYLPLDIVFLLTRESPGKLAYAFGLFFDLHVLTGPERPPRKLQIPSADLFLFQYDTPYSEEPPRFVALGADWAAQRLDPDPVLPALRPELVAALKRHQSQAWTEIVAA